MNYLKLTISSLAILVAVSLSWLMPAFGNEEDAPEISRLKAAFVFNFSKYFTWPENEKWATTKTFNVCVSSSSFEHSAFGQLAAQETQDRQIWVVDLVHESVDIATFCHIWFVDRDTFDTALDGLESLQNSNVLTVSDYPEFITYGGIVELLVVDNKLRFKIDTDIAQREQLEVSSRLLSLALRGD